MSLWLEILIGIVVVLIGIAVVLYIYDWIAEAWMIRKFFK